jgi:hypothetical protein
MAEGVQFRRWLHRGSERLVGMPEDQTFHRKDGVADVEVVEAAMVGDLHQVELAVAAAAAAMQVLCQVVLERMAVRHAE